MYSVSGNLAKIDGRHGKYDGKVNDVDVRYGRNANDNYKTYIQDIGNHSKQVPLQFEYRYMPDGKFNKFALLGSAYEELGQKTKVKTETLNKQLEMSGMNDYSANGLDINQDGYVDVGEYATSTLAQDILSSSDGYNINPSKVDGVITPKGEEKAFALNNKHIEGQARELYGKLYQDFGLEGATKEFVADNNNLVK